MVKDSQIIFNSPRFEYWLDPNPEHSGAIRIIDYKDNKMYGSDPDLPFWVVPFQKIGKGDFKFDFHPKKTHIVNQILYGKLVNNGENLNFRINKNDDPIGDKINSYQKIGQNPEILINILSSKKIFNKKSKKYKSNRNKNKKKSIKIKN